MPDDRESSVDPGQRELWYTDEMLEDPVLEQLLDILGDKLKAVVDSVIASRAGAIDERFQAELHKALDEYVTDAAHWLAYAEDGGLAVFYGFIDAADDKPNKTQNLKAMLEDFVDEHDGDLGGYDESEVGAIVAAVARAKRLLAAWDPTLGGDGDGDG